MVCLLCGSAATEWHDSTRDVRHYRCARCGEYGMTREAIGVFTSYEPERQGLIGGGIRHALLDGRKLELLTTDHVRAFLENAPRDPLEKMDRLLIALAKVKVHPGTPIKIQWDTDKYLAYAGTQEEARYIGTALIDEGLIKQPDVAPTAEGWRRIRALQATQGSTPTAFVAMAFRPDTEALWHAISAAVNRTGWRPIRVDLEVHDDRITDRIEVEIRRSKFVIADATHARPSVYWEAGFARALGKPVFWTAQQGTELHFDTRAFYHILWNQPEEIVESLQYRILSRLGRGPSVPAALS